MPKPRTLPALRDPHRRRQRREFCRRFDDLTTRNVLSDRLGITALPPGPARTRMRILAWSLIVAVYALGWGLSTVRAFELLLARGDYELGPYTGVSFILAVIPKLLVIVIALAAIFVYLPPAAAARPPWITSVRTLPVYHAMPYLAFLAASVLAALLGIEQYDYPAREYPSLAMLLLNALSSALAGPSEELALLALPVIALRRVGYSWYTVCAVAGLLRVPFHMYYGWTTIVFAGWAIAAVLLYRRTRAIGAIIVSHALHNALVYLDKALPGIGNLNYVIAWAAALVVVLFIVRQWRHLRRADARAQRQAME